jgi:hypothetical protein
MFVHNNTDPYQRFMVEELDTSHILEYIFFLFTTKKGWAFVAYRYSKKLVYFHSLTQIIDDLPILPPPRPLLSQCSSQRSSTKSSKKHVIFGVHVDLYLVCRIEIYSPGFLRSAAQISGTLLSYHVKMRKKLALTSDLKHES